MKPLRITMQAFGPYLNRTECDFSSLYDSRLFLITGPTGSGKTTILDAMSFALYGSATGDLRAFRDMRSTRAPAELDTEVVYEFLLGGRQYRFTRTVRLRRKRSGEAEPYITAECVVRDGEGWSLLASGAEAVSKKALELLRFTHDQFSQVIVLPQGEFRRLLLASSREKLEILQVLFALTRWQRVNTELQDRAKTLRETLDQSFRQQTALLEGAGAASAQELDGLAEENKARCEQAGALADRAAKALESAQRAHAEAQRLNAQFTELDAVRAEQAELASRAQEIEKQREQLAQYDKFGRLLPLLRRAEEAKRELAAQTERTQEAAERQTQAQAQVRAAQEAARGAEPLRAQERGVRDELARLSEVLPELERLASYRRDLAKHRQRREAAEKRRAEAAAALETLEQRVENGTQYLAELFEAYLKPRAGWLEEKAALTQTAALLARRKRLTAQICTAEQELSSARDAQRRAAQELSSAQLVCDRAQALLRQNSAHHLALSLKDGAPCPVCGAAHHPAPAPAPENACSREELEAGEALLAQCRAAAQKAESDLAAAQARLESARQELADLDASFPGGTIRPGEADPDELQSRLDALERQIAAAQESVNRYESLSRKLEDLKIRRDRAAASARAEEERRAACDSAVSALEAKIGEIERKLPERSDAARLRGRIGELGAQADALCARADALEHALHDAQSALAGAQAAYTAALTAERGAREASDCAGQELSRACADAGVSPEQAAAAGIVTAGQAATLRESVQNYETRRGFCTRRVRELEQGLNGLDRPDPGAAQAALDGARQAHTRALEESAALSARRSQLRGVQERLRALADARGALEREYGQVCRVAEFCAGKNPSRTPLPNFVLGLILDDVMQAASRYLQKLSRGRYALVRVDAENAAALHGLDIEVVDAHTGGQRKVCTLSGGELFLASLSLAFGLAEVVQSYAGGIELDSIFIDEGFGSLDTETLDAAMRALADIQREGRLVGIISHVADLRARIPARIEIVPAQNGSGITVIPG